MCTSHEEPHLELDCSVNFEITGYYQAIPEWVASTGGLVGYPSVHRFGQSLKMWNSSLEIGWNRME